MFCLSCVWVLEFLLFFHSSFKYLEVIVYNYYAVFISKIQKTIVAVVQRIQFCLVFVTFCILFSFRLSPLTVAVFDWNDVYPFPSPSPCRLPCGQRCGTCRCVARLCSCCPSRRTRRRWTELRFRWSFRQRHG